MGDSAQGLHARLLDIAREAQRRLCLSKWEETRASGWVNPYRCDDGAGTISVRFPRPQDASTFLRPPFVDVISRRSSIFLPIIA